MTQVLCPRCRLALVLEGDSTLTYCPHCGAPQVRLSEELRTQAEQQLSGAPATPSNTPPDPAAVRWNSLIRYAAVTSGAFSVFTVLLPPVSLLAPPVVMTLYAARHRAAAITTGLGAAVGLVCGLFTALGIMLLQVLGLLALRFGTHSIGQLQAGFDAVLLNTRAQMEAQAGPGGGAFLDRVLTVPEFRVGFFLLGMAMVIMALLVLSTLSGAMAGYLRRTHRRA